MSVNPQPLQPGQDRKEPVSLLRFSTMGSVDDGKSTLIGRLLYESNGIYHDQLQSVQRASKLAGATDFSLVTDGLRAEREQGITIDVAYRHFATPRRRFIIADTPGHEQYTRNMATGASTADLALILIDARHGVLPQSRRHAFIANLLGIRRFVVAVNKMDLVDYSQDICDAIAQEFSAFLKRLDAPEALFIPVCATTGENVVNRSPRMNWYSGPPLLEYLETVPSGEGWNILPARFPVQLVIRSRDGARLYAGQIASGSLTVGDVVTALPSRRQTQITQIVTWASNIPAASAPESVSLALADNIDIGRGDMIAQFARLPHAGRKLRANCVWMHSRPLRPGASFFIKHTTHQMRCVVRTIHYVVELNSLTHEPASMLNLNDIGEISLETRRPLFFDAYRDNRATGAAILIDPVTNETVGAITIINAEGPDETRGQVTDAERKARYGHAGAAIAVENREAALILERELFDRAMVAVVFDDEAAAQIAARAGLISLYAGNPSPASVDARDMTIEEVIDELESRLHAK